MSKKQRFDQNVIIKLQNYKKLVDKEFETFFEKQLIESQKIDTSAYQMTKFLKEFNLRGGKRIRAALIFYGFKCFSNKKSNDKDLLKVSIAMELIQSFLLIHDDIIDRDDLRRGGATSHKFFEEIGEKDFEFKANINEKKHFGTAMAIFAGDICIALANTILTKIKIANKNKVIYEMNEIVKNTTFGQIIDVRSGYDNIFSEKTTLKIYKLKTVDYSIELPLKIGAILAGATEKEIKKIKKYAKLLGIAFNIQDDLLELFGEKKKFGKPMGSDLKEGKKTLVILKTLEKATKKEILFIKKKLGNKNISKKDIEKIKKMMIRTGAFDYCIKYGKNLIRKANIIIAKQDYKSEGKSFLIGIGDYLLKRKY